jgi:diguanylate cyclase (GGDEF)-like protein/PAS domain S-box-containing protein
MYRDALPPASWKQVQKSGQIIHQRVGAQLTLNSCDIHGINMPGNTVRLGLMPPLTGLASIYGLEISRAGQIACDEVNENGGVLGRPLQLVIEDDGSLPESAVAAAGKLLDQHHCSAIIGNLLSNSRIAVAYRVAEPRKIPYLNFSCYEGSISSRYFFHFAALPNQQIDRMIVFMRERFGPRMFFAGNNYEWPRGSIHAAKLVLERNGGRVVGEEYYPIGADAESIERLLDHVATAAPDVFVPCFAGADQLNLLTRFAERGLKQRIQVVMGHYDEMMASMLPAEVRADFYSSNTYFMSADTAGNRNYLARLARFPGVSGIWPHGNGILTNFGEGAYVCVKAFAKAANQAGSLEPEALADALDNAGIAAPQGMVQMDPAHRHARVNSYLAVSRKDGTFSILEKFGAIDPVMPERYKHQQVTQLATLGEDVRLQARMLDQLSEGLLLVGSQSNIILYSNAGAERMFGYGNQEMIGMSVARLSNFSGNNQQEIFAEITRKLNRSSEWQGEVCNFKKNGTPIWCSVSVTPFTHPEHGEVWLALYCDVTEQKRADIGKKIHRLVVETARDGFWMYGLTGNLIEVNQAYADKMGYTREELAGMNITRLSASSYTPDLLRKRIEEIVNQGTHSRFETMHRHKDGHIIHYETSNTYLPEAGCIFSFLHDITERRQMENELRIAAIAFESQTGMMITDVNRVILRVNQAFTDSTGYTAEEAVGQTPRLLQSGRHNAEFYQAMWETIHRTGTWQGEIWDRRKNGEIFPKWLTVNAVKGNDGVVTHYVGSHIDITERKAAEREILLLAYYDPLTRLPNRRLLMDRLGQALASSERIGRNGALLLIDLDNFKALNDTLGHQIGDLLLQQVAQRLACTREGDTVARLGGDEFVVLLEGLSGDPLEAVAQVKAIGEKIMATLTQPYLLDRYEHSCTASIGVSLFNDNHQAMDELMKQADIAMYQAKRASRNTMRFFDPQMQANISARVSLESELRKALEKKQFRLHYQIQVDGSRSSLGAEALIRWVHHTHGFVSPAQFIPLAEETGLILPIGQWVLETACAQIRTWQQKPLTRDLVLAVNVSARQFHQADFVAQVQSAVQRHSIDPRLLKLELTESMLQENIEATIAIMTALNESGIQFSLDDFGTGYSSLQYLKRLPLDQLKIDQSFVRDIASDNNDIAIVRTIIAMARSLGISVIAEGVETERQRKLLLENGCSNFQGYLFGKPVSTEQFEASLPQN